MRWAAYAGVSATLATGVLVKALSERPNFYSAAVYLAQSSANLMILTNFVFLCACLALLGLQKLLYGPLRPIEVEQLYERAWLFVTETCLSMTIFRGSFGAWFMVMFFSLLAGKVWGWIGEGRVEILEQQPPANPRLFHTRLAISLSLSVLFATYMLEFSIRTVLNQAKPDMMVMFGFEFAILTILATSTAARYAICLAEIYIVRRQKTARVTELRQERIAANEASRAEGGTATPSTILQAAAPVEVDEAELEVEGWEGKGRWIFYLDLVTDFLKLTVYVAFFSVLLGFYGLPLHIMRDLFLSFRSFFKRVADFVRYRNATRDMNARYPDATPEEVGREDVCIICREEMHPARQVDEVNVPPQRTNPVTERMRPKKLPCGHILHFSCLRSWLERQQNCPTCRRPVLMAQRPQAQGGNAAALPGNVAGQPVHPGQALDQPARNRAQVINLGPLRIGFGAGGGNLIDDLAQRLHNGDQRPPGGAPANPVGPQQFGFGFGFGRRPNPRTQPSVPPTNVPIQAQLEQIERTLQHQIASLQVATNELHTVRMLNNELVRLRNLRANGSVSQAAVPHLSSVTVPMAHPGQRWLPPTNWQSLPPTVLSSHQQQPLSSDSEALPAGMTLPPGWTLLPLQPSGATPLPYPHAPIPALAQPVTTDLHSTPLPSTTMPTNQQITGLADPIEPNALPVASNSNGQQLSSPTVSPKTHSETTRPLPSWGSATDQASDSEKAERQNLPSSVTNGQRTSANGGSGDSNSSSSGPSDAGNKTAAKTNEKAATVEDLVDGVD